MNQSKRLDEDRRPLSDDIEEYWAWVVGTLYILLTLDLLTTVYAAGLYGPEAEANPYVQWALGEGILTIVALNLSVLIILVVLFHGYFRLLRRVDGPEAWVLARSFELWIGVLIAVGLFIFANNLSVIVHGRSLL